MELALGNVPNLKYAKAEFCTENFGGQDTSFTLKGLRREIGGVCGGGLSLATYVND